MHTLTISPVRALSGEIRPPADKSLTHRAFLFAGLATSPSRIIDGLMGEDCMATLDALIAMGCEAREEHNNYLITPKAWRSPMAPLQCGNSGTTMRLLSGCIASREGMTATLIGDVSLSRRPMGRVVEPLRMMGAQMEGDRAPLTIRGAALTGIDYTSPVASAQVKSCVLLAGLNATGLTSVTEPSLSRDHTERMLLALRVPLRRNGLTVTVEASSWEGFEFSVPGDISSAAFWLVAGALLAEQPVRLVGVGVNPTRTGVLEVLEQVGVKVEVENRRESLGEPIADLRLLRPKELRPFRIQGDLVPRLIDEIPVLAVLATQCEGRSVISDAAELKVKESDRIASTCEFLNAMGASVEPTDDGMVIEGPTPLHAGTIHAAGDHRIAMSGTIAGLIAQSGTTMIHGAESIQTSYPQFTQDLEALIVS